MKKKKRNKTRKYLSNQAGFTLIEVIMAIAILAIILSITYSGLNQILRSKSLLDDRRENAAMAHAVLDRMTREFQLAYSGQGLLPRKDDENQQRMPSDFNMIGEQKGLSNGKRGDTIVFMALEAGQYLPDGGTHSGLVQLIYRVEENPEIADTAPTKTYLLIREETPVITPLEKAFSKSMIFPVTENLVSLEYRYFDTEEDKFIDSWNPEQNRKLPSQLEFKMELLSPKGELTTVITTVPMRNIN